MLGGRGGVEVGVGDGSVHSWLCLQRDVPSHMLTSYWIQDSAVQSSLSSTTSRAVLCPLKVSHSVQYPRPPPGQPGTAQREARRTLSSEQSVVV